MKFTGPVLAGQDETMGERIIFYTLHRSGSTYAHEVCRAITRLCGIKYYSPNRGADEQVTARQLAEDRSFWPGRDGCFGPLRFFMPIEPAETDKIILHLRDPRDVLTSMFFSYCFYHSGEVPPATGYRKEVADRGIDEFVLSLATAKESPVVGDYGTGCHLWPIAGNLHNRYRQYLDHLVGRANVVTLRYEEMIADPAAWLRKVASVFSAMEADSIVAGLGDSCRGAAKPEADDIWSHKRHVTPGDHKEKLKPATIGTLNDVFHDVLKAFDYQF